MKQEKCYFFTKHFKYAMYIYIYMYVIMDIKT